MKDPSDDVARVVFAFLEVITKQTFGSPVGGVHDGEQGVQWNAGIEAESGTPFLGVNLEGKEYDRWPIARLIQRELQEPRLFDVKRQVQRQNEIDVWWWQDAWGAGGNRIPGFRENVISPTPISLADLTPDGWERALREAQNCLSAEKAYAGRATRTITMDRDGSEKHVPVSPHLQFRWRLPSGGRLDRRIAEGRELLQPLYDWAKNATT